MSMARSMANTRPQDMLSNIHLLKYTASQDFSSAAFDNIEEERLHPIQYRIKGDGPLLGSVGLNTTISLPGDPSADMFHTSLDLSRRESVDDYIEDMVIMSTVADGDGAEHVGMRRTSLMQYQDVEKLEFKLLDLKLVYIWIT